MIDRIITRINRECFMDIASLLGLLSGIIIIILFGLSGSSAAHFFNPLSLLIVLGGTWATSVLRYFIDNGIEAGRLTATGYGEIMPLEANISNEARARNRRVEFIMKKEIEQK